MQSMIDLQDIETMGTASPNEGWIVVNGIKLHYLEWGKATNPPVLLLHGFLSNANIWDGLASELSRDYRVFALNQRGHGKSDWSATGDYSIDDHFADLVHFIEYLDLKELILIGHSMGGRNALFYAACRPERIEKLVLVDARPGNSDQSVQALKHMLDYADLSASEIEEFVEKADTLYPELPLKAAFDRIHSDSKPTSDQINNQSYDPWLVVASQLADNQVEDLWPFMAGVSCGTLIMRGQYSTFVSEADAENMERLIPSSEISVIPHSSHLPMLENQKFFNQAVLSFMEIISISPDFG